MKMYSEEKCYSESGRVIISVNFNKFQCKNKWRVRDVFKVFSTVRICRYPGFKCYLRSTQSNLAFREENTRCNKETRKARYGAREKMTKNVCTCVHK